MRNKIAAMLGSAVIMALTMPAIAQDAGGASQSVPQPAYPFGGPRSAETSAVEELRKGIVDENLARLIQPDEIGAIKNRKLDAEGAASYPGYAGKALPSARRRDIYYVQGPQQGPENLWLAQNIASPVSFQDQHGNPWPIVSIAYDTRYFSVNGKGCPVPVDGSKTQSDGAQEQGAAEPIAASASPLNSVDRPTFMLVTPCRFWTWSSFTVQLQGLNTPLVFIAGSGGLDDQKYVDVPVLVHIEGSSPSAKSPKVGSTKRRPQAAVSTALRADPGPDSAYQAFLNGTPPRGAMRVGTNDPNASAWLWHGSIYLVAPYSVVTPDYEASARGNDKNIFRFGRTTSRILASADDGSERVISIGN